MATALRPRVLTGSIPVPPHVASRDLASLEALFRPQLWPPAMADGYRRGSRQFLWIDGGRTLLYTIVDEPARDKGRTFRRAASA